MDQILDEINGFGRYQKLVLLIIGTMTSLNAMTIYSTVFTAADPKLLCKYNKNDTNYIENANEICNVWQNITQSNILNKSTEYECEWDTKYYGRTIINEWNLVCDRVYLAGLTQTIFMIGGLSSFFMGYFSDKYGRKVVCFVMALIMCLTFILNEIFQLEVFGLSIDVKYAIYFVSQFSVGFTSYVLYITSYVLLVELTVAKYSTVVSNFNLYLYVFGEVLAMVVAYFVRDWHTIDWFLAGYAVVIVFFVIFILPESPRFLVENNRFEEAYKVLQTIARINGTLDKLVSEKQLIREINESRDLNQVNKYDEDSEDNNLMLEKKPVNNNDIRDQKKSNSILYYLMNPKYNLVMTIILAYVWVAVSMTYYGVSLGITSISSGFDPYLIYLLSAIAEIIGYFLCYLNDKFPRIKVMMGFLGTGGLMCLIVAIIPKNVADSLSWNSILIIVFASIGKAMLSAAFNSGYVITSKLYPTNVRSTMTSLVLSIGRVGSLISPQINLLRTLVWTPLPYLIFSTSSLIACITMFFLPDAK